MIFYIYELIYLFIQFCMCMHVVVYPHHAALVVVNGQLVGISFHLPCGSRNLNSGWLKCFTYWAVMPAPYFLFAINFSVSWVWYLNVVPFYIVNIQSLIKPKIQLGANQFRCLSEKSNWFGHLKMQMFTLVTHVTLLTRFLA